MYNFRNDYSHGAHPEVLKALEKTNLEGNVGYGQDGWCEKAADKIRAACKAPQAQVEFLVGGTQTNFVAIAAMLRPWESVICPQTAHINGHESGAVEGTGHKLIQLPVGSDGKLKAEQIPPVVEAHADPHLTLPRLVYISQATENGTVYTKAELNALSQVCKAHGLLLYCDGARLGVALTSPACDVTLADMAELCDAFYIGGTKNGALMGEALVFCRPELGREFFRMKKQTGSVLAKGWLLGAQFDALFTDDLYWNMARQANDRADRLQAGLKLLGVELMVESTTNQVFPILPNETVEKLRETCAFEVWCPAGEGKSVVRFVCDFATTPEDVYGLLAAIRELREEQR